MLEQVKNKLLEMIKELLDKISTEREDGTMAIEVETGLSRIETLAYCYKCLVDKEVEVDYIPLIVNSKEAAEEVKKTATDHLVASLMGEEDERY